MLLPARSGTGAAGPTRGFDHRGCFAARLFFFFLPFFPFSFFGVLGEKATQLPGRFRHPSSRSTFNKLCSTRISAQMLPRRTDGPGYPRPKTQQQPAEFRGFFTLLQPRLRARLVAAKRRFCNHAHFCATASSLLGFSQTQGGIQSRRKKCVQTGSE